jgi:hypothetical protein
MFQAFLILVFFSGIYVIFWLERYHESFKEGVDTTSAVRVTTMASGNTTSAAQVTTMASGNTTSAAQVTTMASGNTTTPVPATTLVAKHCHTVWINDDIGYGNSCDYINATTKSSNDDDNNDEDQIKEWAKNLTALASEEYDDEGDYDRNWSNNKQPTEGGGTWPMTGDDNKEEKNYTDKSSHNESRNANLIQNRGEWSKNRGINTYNQSAIDTNLAPVSLVQNNSVTGYNRKNDEYDDRKKTDRKRRGTGDDDDLDERRGETGDDDDDDPDERRGGTGDDDDLEERGGGENVDENSDNIDDYILNDHPVELKDKQEEKIKDNVQFLSAVTAYPGGQYAPFDPLNQDINHYEYVAKEFASSQPQGLSDNPMDSNWGGVMYTQNAIKSGKYDENNITKPLLFQPKGIFVDSVPSGFAKPQDVL